MNLKPNFRYIPVLKFEFYQIKFSSRATDKLAINWKKYSLKLDSTLNLLLLYSRMRSLMYEVNS